MLLNKAHGTIFLVILSLALAALACNFPGAGQEQEVVPSAPIPVTTQSLEELEAQVEAANEAFKAGEPVTITVTEEQLTSLIAFELQQQDQQVISNPQVRLRDGHVTFIADVQQSGLSLPLEAVIEVFLGPDGMLDYRIVSAELGPFPLSDELIDQVSAQFEGPFKAQLRAQTEDVAIEELTIADGVLTVRGQRRN